MSKYTDWYPPEIKPVRIGFYQRKYRPTFSLADDPDYWDGHDWYICFFGRKLRRASDALPWRGLRRATSDEAT